MIYLVARVQVIKHDVHSHGNARRDEEDDAGE